MKVKNVFTTCERPAQYNTCCAGRSFSHVNACRLDAPDSHLDSQSKISCQFHLFPGQNNDVRF
jgi:hypothetical protein